VLATFDRVCNLLLSDHRVVALVTPEVGNGPLNAVLEGTAGMFSKLAAGLPVTITAGAREVKIGTFAVSWRQAAVWEPRPDWDALRGELPAIQAHLEQLCTFSSEHTLQRSLLELVQAPTDETRHAGGAISDARQALGPLRAGWEGNVARLRQASSQLAGLGGGLTPSGDDFLTGVMLWAWLAHPTPNDFCTPIAEAAEGRTTTLSMAFLCAAARGECSAAWQALLKALTHKGDAEVARVAENVLAHGATSGADALAGFLWAGLYLPSLSCSAI
jgi:hypothetical protein